MGGLDGIIVLIVVVLMAMAALTSGKALQGEVEADVSYAKKAEIIPRRLIEGEGAPWSKVQLTDPDERRVLAFQLKQDKKRLMAAIKEGKILGKEDVMTLSIIPGLKESVIEWLEQTPGVSVTGGLENTVIAESSIAVWNELLRTKFWEWKENVKENVGIEPRTHRACETMSLPSGKIFSSIVQIEGTVDFPLTSFLKHPIRDVGL